MNRRMLIGWATAVVALGLTPVAYGEEPPIKIGMTLAQTGGLLILRGYGADEQAGQSLSRQLLRALEA